MKISTLVRILVTIYFGFLIQSIVSAQNLPAVSIEATSSTTSASFINVSGATVTLDVTNADKVMVVATFTSRTTSGVALAGYRTADNADPDNISSGEIYRSHNGTFGIGMVIHTYDVSQFSGNKTYIFQHKTDAGELNTSVTLTAIVLYDGTEQLACDHKILSGQIDLPDSWGNLLESNVVNSTAGFYVAAVTNSNKTNGTELSAGEWKLQYKRTSDTTWRDLSYTIPRSTSGTGVGVIKLVGFLPNTLSGNFIFRVVHRKTIGADPIISERTQLSVVALGTGDGFFPVFNAAKTSMSTTSTALTSVLEEYITPQTNTDLFLHAQFGCTSDGASDAPSFDVFVSRDALSLLDGMDHFRALSGASDLGSGVASGLARGLIGGLSYHIGFRHASTTGITLNTNSAYYGGFGLNKSSLPFIAPVSVNATQGLTSAVYSNLKTAFDDINLGIFQGDITIELNTSITETSSCVLNGSGTGSAAYSSVKIFPTAPDLVVDGSIATQLIDLTGASNVTIDGRLNLFGEKSLTFTNTNLAGSVIRFIDDASNNTIRYCNITGVTSSVTNGLIFLSTGSATGNDNNTIEYCDIHGELTTPSNAIYSAGSSVSADNNGSTVRNCNIYNFFNATAASNGILLASNSSAWTISGNRFFQTLTRTSTTGALHSAINVVTASGVGYNINNNIIGYANESGTGTMEYNGAVANLYRAIQLTVGTATPSSVQGNVIANISLSTTSGSTTLPGIFSGIAILAGTVNIGTTTGNIVGGGTGNGSIVVTSTTSLGVITGIYYSTFSSGSIQNNVLGSISTGGTAIVGYTFNGIYTAGTGGSFTISNNIAGSISTANSISIGTNGLTTSPVCTFRGIYNTATGIISIADNTIQNCSVFGTSASVFSGIINAGGTGTLDITGNKVIAGTITGTGICVPITNSAAVATANLNNNIIRNHIKTATTGTFTALSNSGAVLTAININNNQLGNADGGLVNYEAANSAALLGISNSGGAATCELSIQNNDIRGIVHSVAGTSAHTYYVNSAATLKQEISYNTLTDLNVNTTGTIIFIQNSVTMPAGGVQKVNNNSIVTSFTRMAGSGAITLFTSTASTNNTNVSVYNNNNDFSNINLSGTATVSGWINTDAGTGSVNKTIEGNTFSNWTGGTGAITVLNVNITSENNRTRNNEIANISSSGIIYGIITATGNDSIYSNTIDQLNSTGGGAANVVSGINVTAGTTKNIFGNTISNLYGNTMTTGSVRGIYVSAGTTVDVYENTISGIFADAITTGTINGIMVLGGSTVNIKRNKLFDIASTSSGISTGSINGIQVSGAIANLSSNISNNLIGDLRAPLANNTNAIRGVNVISTGASSTIRLYYNTIYLNAGSSGAAFGTSGIYHVYSTTATTASLDMRNNIVVNRSTPNGTGLTVVFRRSSGSANRLNNYALTSNNNLFYAGTPDASRLIYNDGTSSAQTMTEYISGVFTAGTIAPRDQASVSENPSFLSIVGPSANFLHIDTGVATQIESGAVNIPSYTIDYEGYIRQGNAGYTGTSTTAPDMGAVEGDYLPKDRVPPSITYTVITNNSCLGNKTLTAIITDGTGLNTQSGNKPRIYFKKSSNLNVLPATNTNSTDGWKYTETTSTSNPFSFALDYSLVYGGVGTGDIIQYFIVAQDILEPPYVGINAGTFASAAASVDLTSVSFPIGGTINSFTILAGLSGAVTIGLSGNFTSLTGTGGLFENINSRGLSGNLVVTIIDNYISEPGTVSLNPIIYGCEDNYLLTIRPGEGVGAVLEGNVNAPLINLNGADHVIFDGINVGGSSLTIRNINTGTTASTIRFINDATSNIITGCTIEGSGTGTASGVVVFSVGISSGNDGNILSSGSIKPAGSNLPTNAIYSAGSSSIVDNSNITIQSNLIFDYFNAAVASNGVYIAANSSSWKISGNKFYQTSTRTSTAGFTRRAVNIVTSAGENYLIENNIIGFANASSTGITVYNGSFANLFIGIEITVGNNIPSSIQGNTISGISLSTTSGSTTLPGIFSGISVLSGKVNVGTDTGNTIGATTGTAAIVVTSTTSAGVITGMNIASSGLASIKNNRIGAISTGGTAGIAYVFYGISTTGGAQFEISSNIIGSESTANSIAVGTAGVTTAACTFNGIRNAATGAVQVTENTIQHCSVYGTGASIFYGIINTGITSLTNIDGNQIISSSNTGTTTGTTTQTGQLTAIANTAAVSVLNINNNTIRNQNKSVATGSIIAIHNTGPVLSSININNNKLGDTNGGFVNYTVAHSGLLTGISNTAGSVNCGLSIQNNDFRGIAYSVAGTNAITYIVNSAATLTQNISNNTFTNLSVNTTGAIIFISNNVVMAANGIQDINNNSISGTFTRVAASGALSLFNSATATNNPGVTVNNNNNNFSNITISGAATIAGWINTDAGVGNVTKTIDGNTFSNWTGGTGAITVMNVNIMSANNATKNNNINTISSAGTIYAITTGAGRDNIFSNTIHTLVSTGGSSRIVNGIVITAGTLKNVYLNTIYNLQANNITTGSVTGIAVSGGIDNNIYRNKIYNISSGSSGIITGTVNGILVSGAVADQITVIHNNRIGDLKASVADATDVIRGISVVNTGLRSKTNVYYNTVFLNATSSGANFGTTGIYHAASAVASVAALNLRNNIIINSSTPNGAGLTVAYRRSAGTVNALNNYSSSSNNNLFYAGLPGIANIIYTDGTSTAITLSEYRAGSFTAGTIAPRDQSSITDNPHFLSITGASTDFLKIDAAHVTFIESGAANISEIETDFDGDIRSGNPGYPVQLNGFGTLPDIGADEFDGSNPSVMVTLANELSNGSYARLSEAFTAINSYSQSGKQIFISIINNTLETTTATLNAGEWTSIKIFPVTANLSVTGEVSGAPMIDLNGADNVTLDGRVNQTGSTISLTISNTSTSGAVGTSTIRFINSAEGNTIKYCNIKGSSTSSTDGTISFSTSLAGNGNDNNIIEYSNLTNAGGNRALSTIYSVGNSTGVNSGLIIRYNNIYDFLNPAASSNAINLGGYTTDCSIVNNSFYETTTLEPLAGIFTYEAIRINNTTGNNFSINNNSIGGRLANCGGGAFTMNSGTSHSFRAIYLNVDIAVASSIQNNNIKNWSHQSAGTQPWCGIYVNGGNVNIGTVTGNFIGNNSGTGSITLTAANDAASCAIFIGSEGEVVVANNVIGAITTIGSETTVSHSFYAVHKLSGIEGILSVNNNIIGSETIANSLQTASAAGTSSSPQHLIAVFAGGGEETNVSGNNIANLSNAYSGALDSKTAGIHIADGACSVNMNSIHHITTSSASAVYTSLAGIINSGSSDINNVVGNTIYSLISTNAGFSGNVEGIGFSGGAAGNTVAENFIFGLSVNAGSINARIYGIRIVSGTTTYSNNIINLGGNTQTTIYGIYETGTSGNNNNIYFNTVFIGGSLENGVTNKSYSFYSAAATNTRDFRNNIFSNFRSTTNGSSLHYAAWFNYGTNSNLTLDYNDYFANGTGGVLGFYNGSDVSSLPIVISNDANSTDVNPQFSNGGGTMPEDYRLSAPLSGVNGTGIFLDYGSVARSNPPNMGAWEFFTNRWKGSVSTDFADPANWTSLAVPINNAPVVFDNAPVNHCVLDVNRSVGSITNSQSTYDLVVNGKQLTIRGSLFFENGAQIDAGADLSVVIFAGTAAQTIPAGAFTGDAVYDLTINNSNGVILAGDITILNTMNLNRANPSATIGCLDAGSNSITLGPNATTIGVGDATGIVKRTSIAANTTYTFGNKFATVYFSNTGTLPTIISVKTTIGEAPLWHTGAVKRTYDITQTGANPLNPTSATIMSAYLDSELNGNDEEKLVNWSYRYINSQLFEHGRASHNSDENWIRLTNINIAFFPQNFDQLQVGIDEGELETLTWNGSVSNSWTTVNNWTPMGAPSDYVNIIVPDATTTNNDPVLPAETTIKTLTLENGAVLNASDAAQATIVGGAGAWVSDGGTFNPGNSQVIFTNGSAFYAGESSFYNINLNTNCELTMDTASIMRIAGSMNNSGTWRTVYGGPSIVDYNGGDQTIVVPNTATNRYSTLMLSGSGTKTMPSVILSIYGDFLLSGNVNVTAQNNLVVGGSFSIGADASFVTGTKNHTIGGDFTYDGSFNATGSTITFNGFVPQVISGGASSLIFENLTFLNDQGVTSSLNLVVNGNLDLQSNNPDDLKGCLDMGTATLTLGAATATTGPGDVTGIVKRGHAFIPGIPYTFGNRYTTVSFCDSGTKPTEVSIKTSIGNAPGWKPAAIKRIFDFVQSGGSNCAVDVSVKYLESELNGNNEEELVYWGAYGFPTPTSVEWGRSETDTLNRSLLLKSVQIDLWPTTFDQMLITLAETEHPTLTWNGSQSTMWGNANNWTPAGFPNEFTRLIIPNASSTPNDPVLPLAANADELKIEAGGILNASTDCEIHLYCDQNDVAWENYGSFNAANSTVVFRKAGIKIAGTTDFYNVTILPDADLIPQAGNIMRIAGTLTNGGVLDATQNSNTIDYNGTSQMVIIPNGTTTGYYNLTISGSDVKTMPDNILDIYGNFSISGTANVTAKNDLHITNLLSIGSNSSFNTDGKYLTIGGDIIHDGVFNVSQSIVELVGTTAQSINGSASSTIFKSLLIHQLSGAVCNKAITVNDILCLHNANPGPSTPVLNLPTHTLDLGPLATVIGNGDATGIVRRTNIERNVLYAFGNKNAAISFNDAGTIPTEMSVRISIGTAPAWRPGAIQRVYEIIQSGANPFDATQATIHSAYLDSELNGNDEERLVNWSYRNPPGMHLEHGRSDHNATENWLELTNINMAFFPSTFGTLYITMDESEIENLTWNGSVSSSWTTVNNWTPNGAPSSFVNVTIPDASTTLNDPYLNYVSEVKTLTIEEGGILNSSGGSTFNIYGGVGAWSNSGTFNPGSTSVFFKNAGATIGGETNFYNLSIPTGASLTPLTGNIMRIGLVLSNEGTLDASANSNTIEYNGTGQTVILPNGTTPGYHSLSLSGSGIKTLPSAAFNIFGDFSLSEAAQATAINGINISGSLSVGSMASFTTGAYTHSLGGNLINDGGLAISAGNTILMNGSLLQTLSGIGSLIFNNLTINSAGGVVSAIDFTINGALYLQSSNPSSTRGSLHLGENTLTMGAAAATTGNGDVTGIVRRTSFIANTSYTFGNQFTTMVLSPGGTLPSEIKMKIEIGTAPAWKPESIKRQYDIAQTGGSSLTATLRLHYLDSELNNNAEASLKIWNYDTGTSFINETGRDDQSASDNWISISNLDIAVIPVNFNDHLWSLYSSVFVVIEDVKGWRMIASPTATTYSDLLDGFVTQGMTGSTYPARQPNFLWFDETEGLTTNMSWRTPEGLSNNIKPGRGYYFYVFGDIPDENDYNDVLPKQMSTSGVPNYSTGSFSYLALNHPVTFTDRTGNQTAPGTYYDQNIADEGWNMIGNPSTRSLNWDHTSWTKTNIDNSIYLWDPLDNEWKTWNGFTGNMGNGLISPFQAFWVRANNPDPELSFTDEVLTSGGHFYGGGPVAKSQSTDLEPINVKVTLNAGDQKSTVFITFTKDAVAGPDKYDAYRLEPLSDTWLELYTLSSTAHTMPMAINALPSEGPETFNLPLFVGGQNEGNSLNGEFELSWELPANWPSDWTISLNDHNLQKAISMIAGNNYSFGYSATKQVAVAGSSGDSLFSLPGNLLKPVSLQSIYKSSNQLSPFNIVIEKGANNTEPSYVSQQPKLLPNYPNPFRGSTTIRFSLPETETISLDLYDIAGRLIEVIEHKSYESGVHDIHWHNNSLKSGIYLLYLRTETTNDVIKLNLQN